MKQFRQLQDLAESLKKMGLQALSILTEGIWASLTGGWYYDEKQSHFSNLFHLYIWLIFLCFPFINYLFFNTFIAWILYCSFIGLIFTTVKIINEYFHRIFDAGRCITTTEKLNELNQDPNLVSSLNNDDDSGGTQIDKKYDDKETLEMITISQNSPIKNVNNHKLIDESNLEPSLEKSNPNSSRLNLKNQSNESNEDNCSNEITSKTIDLKADVHNCNNDSETSSFGNLSLLFRISNEKNDQPTQTDSSLTKLNASDDAIKLFPGLDTSLTNIDEVYTNKNSSSNNNSVGVLDNLDKLSQMHTFRRARSEIETVKKTRPTIAVPPSHPVSLELINTKDEKISGSLMVKDRFRENDHRNQKYSLLQSKLIQKCDENDELMISNSTNNPKDAEQQNEKSSECSNAYIKKDFDSSEDGDESEISLCKKDSNKHRINLANKKLLKQPTTRKTRFSGNRKRMKSGRIDWNRYNEIEQKYRQRSANMPLFTSDYDETDSDQDEAANVKRTNPDKFQQIYRSGSSSSLPSSSSSSTSSLSSSSSSSSSFHHPLASKKRDSNIDLEVCKIYPSTSTGIVRTADRKRFKKKYLAKNSKKLDDDSSIKKFSKARTSDDQSELNELNHQQMDRTNNQFNLATRENESSRNSTIYLPSSSVIFGEIISAPGTHLATSHEDTTIGAVHVFQDERGNWFSYMFDQNSTGLAKGLCSQNLLRKFSSNTQTSFDEKTKESSFKYPDQRLIPSTSSANQSTQQSLEPSAIVLADNFGLNQDSISKLEHLVLFNHENVPQQQCQSVQTPESLSTNNHRSMFFDQLTRESNYLTISCGKSPTSI